MASRHAGFRGIGTENIRFAFRAMVSQKLRSFLTLLGIVAGVATVIAMVSFVSGFNAAVTDSFSAFGTTLVQFQKYEPRFGGGGPCPRTRSGGATSPSKMPRPSSASRPWRRPSPRNATSRAPPAPP